MTYGVLNINTFQLYNNNVTIVSVINRSYIRDVIVARVPLVSHSRAVLSRCDIVVEDRGECIEITIS